MKSLSRYLYRILFRNLLLVFILCTLFGFLIALGVHAATSEQQSLDSLRLKDTVGELMRDQTPPLSGSSPCRGNFRTLKPLLYLEYSNLYLEMA